MASTTYTITKLVDDAEVEVATKSKKSVAIELAQTTYAGEKVAVRVVTNKGTTIFELAAPTGKRVIINKTKAYTRIDSRELPEGASIPEGYELTYLLPRNKMAVVRNPEVKDDYLVVDFVSGEAHPVVNCKQASKLAQALKAARKTA